MVTTARMHDAEPNHLRFFGPMGHQRLALKGSSVTQHHAVVLSLSNAYPLVLHVRTSCVRRVQLSMPFCLRKISTLDHDWIKYIP